MSKRDILGLSLFTKIAKKHNGTISISGKKENSAGFLMTLPLKQAQFIILIYIFLLVKFNQETKHSIKMLI
jgi:hypothetical protein